MKINFPKFVVEYFKVAGLKLIKLKKYDRFGVNLNVGCGAYEIDGFISLDFYTGHYYTNRKFKRIHYDMRSDDLPFESDSVDTIYCSHVIEHIETNYVKHFLEETYRVLKKRGVLRIVCPDSRFLYQAMREFPEFYRWHPMYKVPDDAIKCFIDEVATHRVNFENYGLEKNIMQYDYDELMIQLREMENFTAENPGRHINSWDFKRLKEFGQSVGYIKIIESRCQASCCPALQGCDMDLTHPEMSLYIDLVKSDLN